MDKFLAHPGRTSRDLEHFLGAPRGHYKGNDFIVVEIPRGQTHGLRIPSGNETGANSLWLPGGRIHSGAREAVIDAQNVDSSKLIIRDLILGN